MGFFYFFNPFFPSLSVLVTCLALRFFFFKNCFRSTYIKLLLNARHLPRPPGCGDPVCSKGTAPGYKDCGVPLDWQESGVRGKGNPKSGCWAMGSLPLLHLHASIPELQSFSPVRPLRNNCHPQIPKAKPAIKQDLS